MNKINAFYKKYRDKLIEKFGLGFYHDPIMLVLMGLFAVLLIVALFMIIFRIQPANIETPLLYNVIYGVTSIGVWYYLYYYLFAIIVIGVANLLIAWSLFEKERLLSYLLGISNITLVVVMTLYIYNLTALLR